jgi:hypothetical protein
VVYLFSCYFLVLRDHIFYLPFSRAVCFIVIIFPTHECGVCAAVLAYLLNEINFIKNNSIELDLV